MTNSIGVAVVDGQTFFAAGIASILKSYRGFEVVGVGNRSDDAVRLATQPTIDVLLLDVRLPNAMQMAKRLSRRSRPLRIIMMVGSEHDLRDVSVGRIAAHGWLLRRVDRRELVKAIQTVHDGSLYVSRGLEEVMIARSTRDRVAGPSLTNREVEVLAFVRRGLSNTTIAKLLGLQVPTIRAYVARVLRKLKVKGRRQLLLTDQATLDTSRSLQ